LIRIGSGENVLVILLILSNAGREFPQLLFKEQTSTKFKIGRVTTYYKFENWSRKEVNKVRCLRQENCVRVLLLISGCPKSHIVQLGKINRGCRYPASDLSGRCTPPEVQDQMRGLEYV